MMIKKFQWLFYWVTALFFVACTDNEPKLPVIPEIPIPGALRDGITVISDDSLAFVLFAPYKQEVYLIGDFNNWTTSEDYKMNKDSDRFWIKIGGLVKGKEYICQYLIDNSIRVADPYCNKISDPWNDHYISSTIYPDLIAYPTGKTDFPAMVVNTAPESYSWSINSFKIEKPERMVIYELLIRDFTEERSIKALTEKIPYLKSLGINAVELMPFNEFEGNDSWGYNPSFYFATDKAYGTSNDYKKFIDECHKNGIGVIMDIVLNHSYGQSPLVRMYDDGNYNPTAENPWYNQQSNFANTSLSWGQDFNHDSEHTRAFVDSVFAYWMSEYKIDGFRLDFTKGFSNTPYAADSWGSEYDGARINNLKRIYDEITKRNPDALMICEHLTDNLEEKILANYGMYLWGNMNYSFNEATMGWGEQGTSGYNGDVTWSSYQAREWDKPHLIAYMESHDEERIMFKNLAYGDTNSQTGYNVRDLKTALQRTEAAAVILFTIPGPKMIWQFGEMGYDLELNDDRLAPKPPHWEYLDDPDRAHLKDVFATMIKLRNEKDIFSTTDFTIDVAGNYKQVLLNSATESVCAIANFGMEARTETIYFGKSGTWADYFGGSSIIVKGAESTITLQPGEYRLYFN